MLSPEGDENRPKCPLCPLVTPEVVATCVPSEDPGRPSQSLLPAPAGSRRFSGPHRLNQHENQAAQEARMASGLLSGPDPLLWDGPLHGMPSTALSAWATQKHPFCLMEGDTGRVLDPKPSSSVPALGSKNHSQMPLLTRTTWRGHGPPHSESPSSTQPQSLWDISGGAVDLAAHGAGPARKATPSLGGRTGRMWRASPL